MTPNSAKKHEAILRAATEFFLRDGFERSSVDAIAAAAGVGKQTVYGHFTNKERLFLAVVERARKAVGVGPKDLAALMRDSGDPRTDLVFTGERLLRAVTAPDMAALHRLTIAELPHHPELMTSWRDESGSKEVVEAVATYLSHADKRKTLRVPDPMCSARQFVMLLSAEGQVRSLRGLKQLSTAQIREIATETADLILRAHRP